MFQSLKIGLGVAAAASALAVMAPANAQGRRDISWRGDVDDTVIVYIHGDRTRTETLSGNGPRNVRSNSFGRLPDRPVTVFLSDREGRGRIRVVQQPGPDNDYTAAVRISDPEGGSSRYRFTLSWRGPNGGWDNRAGYDNNRYDNSNWNGNGDRNDNSNWNGDRNDNRDWNR